MDIGESKKVVDAMVETLSIGGCINKITNYLSFVLWDMLGVDHCALASTCEEFGQTQQGEPKCRTKS
jgi:hypothetical protein